VGVVTKSPDMGSVKKLAKRVLNSLAVLRWSVILSPLTNMNQSTEEFLFDLTKDQKDLRLSRFLKRSVIKSL
jgi:hypothetical protein